MVEVCSLEGESSESVTDIAHISFLDMIKVLFDLGGTANAKGTLIRNALNTADKISQEDYDSFDAFLQSVEDGSNPISMMEGKAVYEGGNVFGLPACPFAKSIKNYPDIFHELPKSYEDFTIEFNKSTRIINMYNVGEGAGLSPFWPVHQPLRSALGDKIKIGGKNVTIYQLGCKSGSGKKGFGEKWIEENGVAKDVVDKVLDDNMCCYYLKVAE